MAEIIKQIQATNGSKYDIDAKYWDGHQFSEITNLVHGVVDTYVIPAQTGTSATSDYKAIVESTAAQVTTTKDKLGALTGVPAADWDKFGVGDIVLMGATSDGKVNFDRWISSVDDSGNVTLDVLETQVATHHHTFPSHTISNTSAKVLTDVTIKTTTTNNVAYAGSDVTVLQGTAGDYVTSVDHDNNGKHSLTLATGTSTSGHGHKHTVTVSNHNHTVKFTPTTIVSQSINAYTSLTTGDYTPHKHATAVTAAGAATNSASFKYVNGGSTDTFLKGVTDASTASNTGENSKGVSTGNNTTGLSTSTQASTDTIGDVVKTTSAGAHTHSVSATTTEDAIKTVSLAGNVTTSVKFSYTAPTVAGNVTTSAKLNYTAPTVATNVTTSAKLNYTAPTVAANVVTSVTTANKTVVTGVALSDTTTFVNTATVTNGVLSFGTASVTVSASTTSVKAVSTITSATQSAGSASLTTTSATQSAGSASLTTTSTTQSAGSASLTYTSATQTYTSGKLTATCTTGSNGAHQHGFSHTHAIPAHNHSIEKHTHTYYKTVGGSTGSAYISLTSANHTPHTHEASVTAAGSTSNDTKITYVKSGTSTAVVRNLLSTEYSCTVGSTQPGATVSNTYMSISGTITFPGLTVGKKALSTTTVKPAVDSGEKPAMSLTLTSVSVVKTLTSTQTTGNTSTNVGGSPA